MNANRAVFEQGHPTQELENNILLRTQLERQRELDMLRSRFNRNKEMAQVAAGSCIRTSESSEVKSTSPKSSPVCPVKPTPALVKQISMVPSYATTFGAWPLVSNNLNVYLINLHCLLYFYFKDHVPPAPPLPKSQYQDAESKRGIQIKNPSTKRQGKYSNFFFCVVFCNNNFCALRVLALQDFYDFF